MKHLKRLAVRCLLLVVPALLACSPQASDQSFQATDITGADFGREFELLDHNGKLRHLSDFHGKVVVMFFGFTHCPDVCPTSLAEFSAALARLDDTASQVQVLFVTVDPERDTAELLRSYVTAFNPGFLGMTGSNEQIAKVAREFRIIYQKVEGKSQSGYSVDHSAGTYIFDPKGRLRLYSAYGSGSDALVSDLTLLLDGA